MSRTLTLVQALAAGGDVRASAHGYDELAADGLFFGEVIAGVRQALVVEDYPDHPRGPCVLVLQSDEASNSIHVVWGIPKGREGPAVLVTAYRPDPSKWSADFKRRLP